jgi:hypothetical protein
MRLIPPFADYIRGSQGSCHISIVIASNDAPSAPDHAMAISCRHQTHKHRQEYQSRYTTPVGEEARSGRELGLSPATTQFTARHFSPTSLNEMPLISIIRFLKTTSSSSRFRGKHFPLEFSLQALLARESNPHTRHPLILGRTPAPTRKNPGFDEPGQVRRAHCAQVLGCRPRRRAPRRRQRHRVGTPRLALRPVRA